MKYIGIILLFASSMCFGQTPVEVLIDSLNFANNPEEKIELSKQIALELTNSDWNKAVDYLELAEVEAKSAKNIKLELAAIYIALGDVFWEKDFLDVTLEYYLKAYDIYVSLKDSSKTVFLENNLAIIYAQLEDKEKALEYFSMVLNNQLILDDSVKFAQILNNIGNLYLQKDIDSSLYYFHKSLDLSEKLKNDTLLGYNYTNIGRIFTIKNESESALIHFDKALKIADTSQNNALNTFIYKSIAKFYNDTRQADSSIVYAKQALASNRGDMHSFVSLDVNKILFEAYKDKKDYKNAVYHFEQYNTIRDSLNIEEKAINAERLKLQQEYKDKEQARVLLEEKKRSKYTIVGLGLISGILVLMILLVKYKNKISRTELEKELLVSAQNELHQNLQNKNKILISKAMVEMHRTETVKDILNDLKQIKRTVIKKETREAIDYILKNLQANLNSNIWREFEVSFEQVHESFCEALKLKHPDLTPKERRLCSLLYLDLSSKEIALLTGQTFKAIENARTRLRKKINLTKEKINLSSYLHHL